MEKEPKEQFQPQPYYIEDDEIDLYELYLTLKKRKKIVWGITGLFTLVALILCFVLPKTYRTEITLMPLGGESKGGLSSFLSSLPISLPGMSQSGITVESILKSRILKEQIIEDLNLLPLLFPDEWDNETKTWKLDEDEKPPTLIDGAKALDDLISVSTDKTTGVITVDVDFKNDPEIAYKIAEDLLNATNKILEEKTFTVSKKYREYLGKQLQEVKSRLEKLQRIYAKFIQGKIKEIPMLSFDNNTINNGKKEGRLIAEREKIKAVLERKELSPQDRKKLQDKLNKIKAKIKKLKTARTFISVPNYQFNLIRLKTELAITQGLYQSLVKEYELAKAQEMRDKIAFQVIDPPYIPEKPYKPKKALIIIVGLISGLFIGIFAAFFKEWLDNVKERHKVEENG
ncbi:Wzz/FepE/Etk N-terminal domain-containing protein [Desulfurobacterium sp.]|uniref:GumC family protein n=1 Tax=Desulfurobacterium sp. TaxID=2004706 RepID=UPI0026140362|nr:Wzz/FepE/Etk N-terminal domain-containing protein [Desulfurobacterium sp.]